MARRRAAASAGKGAGKSSSASKGTRRRVKKNNVNVDFTGTESRVLIPVGEYNVKVEEVTQEVSEAENPYLSWKFRTISDDKALDNQMLYYNTSLQPQALWNLRNLLESLEVDVPDGPMDIDTDELVDMEMIAIVDHENYEGRDRSKIVDFISSSDSTGGSEKEEEVKVESNKDELEMLTEDEISDMSIEELGDVVEEYSLDVSLKKLKTARKKVNAVLDALEESGYLEMD